MSKKSINLYREFVGKKAIMSIPVKTDVREILCDVCCDVAGVFGRSQLAETLDGLALTCECCGVRGRLTMCDDEGTCWVEFRSDDGEENAC